jgi:hypothetical protein
VARAQTISYDTRDIVGLLKNLRGVQDDLRKNDNKRLREAAAVCAVELVADLKASARGTPQAGLVASTARVKSDRIPAVSIGGNKRVGHRGTAAGVLVWGSERGGRNFAAPHNSGGYWIEPTTRRFQDGPAARTYLTAVYEVLRDRGVL